MEKYIREHYTHFILGHAKELRDYISKNSNDYYDDSEMIEEMFVLVFNEYIGDKAFKVFGIGVADVVGDKWFFNRAIELYEETNKKEVTNEVKEKQMNKITLAVKESIGNILKYNLEEEITKDTQFLHDNNEHDIKNIYMNFVEQDINSEDINYIVVRDIIEVAYEEIQFDLLATDLIKDLKQYYNIHYHVNRY